MGGTERRTLDEASGRKWQSGYGVDTGDLHGGRSVEGREEVGRDNWPASTFPSPVARPSVDGDHRPPPPPAPGGPGVVHARPRGRDGMDAQKRRSSPRCADPTGANQFLRWGATPFRPRSRVAGPKAVGPGQRAWMTSARRRPVPSRPLVRCRRRLRAAGLGVLQPAQPLPAPPEGSRRAQVRQRMRPHRRQRDRAPPQPRAHRWRSAGRDQLPPSASQTGPALYLVR